MSTKEAERLRLIKNHASGIISLREVSNLLDISYRQTLRLWSNFQLCGESAFVSKKRNNCNRSLESGLEDRILSLIRKYYSDYGHTLLSEKLEELHYIKISKETIRKIMIMHGLRQSKKQKQIKIYQRRKRRSCFEI